MATKVCIDCKQDVPVDANVCFHCGYRFPTARNAVGAAVRFLIVVCAGLLIGWLFIVMIWG